MDVSRNERIFIQSLSFIDCQQAFHRECAINSEKCLKDRKTSTISNSTQGKPRKPLKNPSSKMIKDNLKGKCFFLSLSNLVRIELMLFHSLSQDHFQLIVLCSLFSACLSHVYNKRFNNKSFHDVPSVVVPLYSVEL